MNIELKNVKYFAAGSEETSCFVATVWVDGGKAGEASNHGTGGPTDVHPFALQKKLDDYGLTLPKAVVDLGDGKTLEYAPSAETIIGDLLDEYLISKDLKRILAKRIIYTKVGQRGIFQSQVFDKTKLAAMLVHPQLREKWHIDALLNTLDFDAALRIYKEQG